MPSTIDGPGEPVIETSGLTKRFGSTLAVDAVSLTVRRGQVFGFLGPNGSGKTTTLGMLLGVLTPSAGECLLLGHASGGDLRRARRRVGAILERPNFYPHLSGRDNLTLVAHVKDAPLGQVQEALALVSMNGRAGDPFGGYSLGMKQRLALAAATLGEPELLILDEPANGLDPEGMREIREIIQRMADRGTTIFLSSHRLREVERTCTHVGIIDGGRLVYQGAVNQLAGGRVVAALDAAGRGALFRAVQEYPATVAVRREEDGVVAELRDDDLAALNRYLSDRGVHLSRLGRRHRSLEDVFMEVTHGSSAPRVEAHASWR